MGGKWNSRDNRSDIQVIKKYCKKAMKLTQYILEQYWQRDLEPLLSHIDDDILWIGSMDEEYLHGKQAMMKRIKENNNEMPLVYLDNQEYEIVQNTGRCCVVVGRYRAFTKPESGMLLSEKQRVTFVWEKDKTEDTEQLLIKHIHLSNILHIQDEDERFPTKAGKENYEYVMKIMAERSQNAVITVKDENHASRVINYSDIMYIISDHNYIVIHLANELGTIKVRGNLSTFSEKLTDSFIQSGRSLCFNKNYVKILKGRNLEMIDGRQFGIPATAVKKVREKMNKT